MILPKFPLLPRTTCRLCRLPRQRVNCFQRQIFVHHAHFTVVFLQQVLERRLRSLAEWALKNGKSPQDEALRLLSNTFIINSADFGSYQSRKRSISGEIISKRIFVIPTPSHVEKGASLNSWRTLEQLIDKLPPPSLKTLESDIIDPVYPEIKIKALELTDHFYDSGLYECEWRQSKELKTNHHCMGKMSFPENLDKPSRTVTATKSGTSREGLIYKSDYIRKGDGEYRSPTVREISSIMGFPITYQFTGNLYFKPSI